jgi:F0F1-type ATP synthase membrane subunit a
MDYGICTCGLGSSVVNQDLRQGAVGEIQRLFHLIINCLMLWHFLRNCFLGMVGKCAANQDRFSSQSAEMRISDFFTLAALAVS